MHGYGARLKECRGDRSRREVAEAIGISVSAMTMYENEERIPRDQIKKRLAEYFGKTVDELFFA